MGKAKKRVNPKVTNRVDRNLKELTVKTALKHEAVNAAVGTKQKKETARI